MPPPSTPRWAQDGHILQVHCGLLGDLDGFATPHKSPNFPLSTDGKEGVIGSSPILGFM